MRSRGLRLLASVAIVGFMTGLWTPKLSAALPQTRTISLYNIHTKETVTVEYKKDGKYVPAAMDQIDWVLRDWRRHEKTRMDPELIDLLWEVHAELGSREPIHIISGFRSRSTNEMLRSTVGGQASQSRHILGKAADVHFPDVPVRRIRYSALIREKGGVGYYPTSAVPFVHLDTDRVRAWPRLPRHELALLFPNGRTQHVPADGQPLTPADVQSARTEHGELAAQVAEVLELHKAALSPAARIAIADASRGARAVPAPEQRMALMTPLPQPAAASGGLLPEPRLAAPKLVSEPRLADRPARIQSATDDADRLKLAQLAALASLPLMPDPMPRPTPVSLGADEPHSARLSLTGNTPSEEPRAEAAGRFRWGATWASLQAPAAATTAAATSWAVAPAYDEEHPEELSYRPFPIAPYMTETASPDDPALARMEHHDAARTLELLDQTAEQPPMRLRPGPQVARVLWAQQFQGEAVSLARIFDERTGARGGLAERSVRISAR